MKRKVSEELEGDLQVWGDSNQLGFTPLGSGREVGRSCHMLEFKGKTIMLDCGIHPGRQGENMLPYLDQFDMSKIDLLLITHFHLDHAGALPYITEKTSFKGQIFMTFSTKAVLRIFLKDFARILESDPDGEPLYTQEQLQRSLDKCQTIGFHHVLQIEGIKITPYHAGHVLGAAMFLIEIAGVKILYTGDFSREDDRHLKGAEVPSGRPDVLVIESTFGSLVSHDSRQTREKRFIESVEKILLRGGNCLIPIGALGAAQEMLLILEDHWNQNPHLKVFPIYHTSRIANEALNVYRNFMNEMSDSIKNQQLANPWSFENIASLGENEEIAGPAVVLASPGYLQSGKSRRLFELWCQNPKNGVILAGYSVEGTLAKDLSKGRTESIISMNGTHLSVACEINTEITFSAHSDQTGTLSFVEQLKPKNIILVHGEQKAMRTLKKELEKNSSEQGQDTDVFNPENSSTISLKFAELRVVKAYGGELVHTRMRKDGERISGFLVRKDFADRFISTDDLRLYTQLKTALVNQKLHLPFHAKFDLLQSCISKLFDTKSTRANQLIVFDKIELNLVSPPGYVIMTWDASPSNDMIADAITAVLMQYEGGVAAVRIGTCCSGHSHQRAIGGEEGTGSTTTELKTKHSHVGLLVSLLQERFGIDSVTEQEHNIMINSIAPTATISLTSDGHVASIKIQQGESGEDMLRVSQVLEECVRDVVWQAYQALHPVL